MTQNQLLQAILTKLEGLEGFVHEQRKFNDEVRLFMEEQKKFNNEVQLFMEEQKKFNNEVQLFMEEQKKFNNEVQLFMEKQKETNKRLSISYDELVFLIEYEIVDRFSGMSDGVKVYTDGIMRKHESRYRHIPSSK